MPKKHLSQNFLFDPSILGRICDAAGVGPGDTVVEAGPGPGGLTRVLCQRAGRVIAVELDRELADRLGAEMAGTDNLELIAGDAMKYPFNELSGEFKVVANIPYHITTPLMFRFMELGKTGGRRLASMTLTIQKEVAQRVAAGPGTKSYGVLSIMVQYRGKPKLAFTVPAGAFRPVPKVDSACLHVEMYDKPAIEVVDEELFFSVVRAAFSQRRKTLANSLKKLVEEALPGALSKDVIKSAGVDPGARPETLDIAAFAAIADAISGR